MTKTTIVGYPRIGIHRELKFAVEKYFRKEISEEELQKTAKELRKSYLTTQKKGGIDIIPSNDFSFYDNEQTSAASSQISSRPCLVSAENGITTVPG